MLQNELQSSIFKKKKKHARELGKATLISERMWEI